MRVPVLFLVAAGFLVAADAPSEAVRKELDKFRGTWKFESLEVEGQKVPEAQYQAGRLTLKGDQFTYAEGENSHHGTFKVDPTKKPKTIDITFTDGPHKGDTLHGIYELEGDTYKVCLDMKGKDRPKEFTSKPDSGHILEVLKRVKP